MGLLSGLLTGGLLVGKICQAVAGIAAVDDDEGLEISDPIQSGNVVFFRSNVGGSSVIKAFNTNTSTNASISIPNNHDEGGLNYMLPPTQSIIIPELSSPNTSPHTVVSSGLTDPVTGPTSLAGGGKGILRLAFQGLNLGKVVKVGSFRISCNTSQLIIVSSFVSVNALTYMWLNSDKGASVSNQSRIDPSPKTTEAEFETRFDIDFSQISIDPKADLIEGQLSLEIPTSGTNALIAENPTTPQNLHPFEAAHLRKLGLVT